MASYFSAAVYISSYDDGTVLKADLTFLRTDDSGGQENVVIPLNVESTEFDCPEDMIRYVLPQVVEQI